MRQAPAIVWFTGLSGSGKSTIAQELREQLQSKGIHSVLLDGDGIRLGLNSDLGFSMEDRMENLRRIAEVARLIAANGYVAIVACISPLAESRKRARDIAAETTFIEVFVDTPLSTCQQRDPKGHYRSARDGQLTNFTGIDSPYETPDAPEVHLRTTEQPPAAAAQRILKELETRHGTSHG